MSQTFFFLHSQRDAEAIEYYELAATSLAGDGELFKLLNSSFYSVKFFLLNDHRGIGMILMATLISSLSSLSFLHF